MTTKKPSEAAKRTRRGDGEAMGETFIRGPVVKPDGRVYRRADSCFSRESDTRKKPRDSGSFFGDTSRGMSQENVEIVKRANEFLGRRDWPGIASTDLIDPNVELHGSVGGLEEGNILRGLSEISQAFDTEDRDVWDEHRIEPREYIDAGDRVVVLHREYQRGKGSGVEIVIDTASILDVRDGRIVRMQGYMNPAEALEAVGLSEQDVHTES
jgi:ketosteroid isomerase-like protein